MNGLRGLPPLARLAEADLTGVEAKLADVLSQGYPEAALLSARSMAEAAGTSPASVTRFARKLGYSDFAELQAELAVDMRARLSSPPKRLTVDVPSRRKTTAELLRNVVARDRENLDATLSMIDEAMLDALMRRLAHGSRSQIYVTGSKKGSIVASYFAMQLAQLRRGVRLLSLSDLLADELLDMTGEDLLVIFEPRRATAMLVSLLTRARSVGAHVAAFTDEHPPGIIAESDFLFRTKVDAISVFDSYAAMFALCDALLAAVALHVPRVVRERAERLEELNDALSTWYQPRMAPARDAGRGH
ncbi:MAG TPA: MurR/RpiR family transcriptional regulator [Streptosporangiaceae bacterium]|nr:MurR/RpiR family transcriptional regulator [Streptosporangiaceae bacterium]